MGAGDLVNPCPCLRASHGCGYTGAPGPFRKSAGGGGMSPGRQGLGEDEQHLADV